jgi:hypothetical protein
MPLPPLSMAQELKRLRRQVINRPFNSFDLDQCAEAAFFIIIIMHSLSEERSMQALLPQKVRWSVLSAVAQWWRRWTRARSNLFELDSCDPDQVERIARELGMSVSELRVVVRHGRDGADLLRRRMAALDLDLDELGRSEPATLRDLQRLCTMCRSRGRCARDLARKTSDQDWRDYCADAATLDMLSALKNCSDVRG